MFDTKEEFHKHIKHKGYNLYVNIVTVSPSNNNRHVQLSFIKHGQSFNCTESVAKLFEKEFKCNAIGLDNKTLIIRGGPDGSEYNAIARLAYLLDLGPLNIVVSNQKNNKLIKNNTYTGFPERKVIDQLRKQYPVGTIIRMVESKDPYHPIKPGTIGEVTHVDDAGTIHTKWNNKSFLGLIPDEDTFIIMKSN